ncbi:hypothetical protein IFM89_014093 [Coptis chinensis]|uniref:N(6)-L-threonylcarbamoyladenine synthase n=1 Tax=Coptis chinensis TaxID=261450 RepID=A0A835GW41_9MAGN|nr:hypothetical protein IFM89_014093 [Coptis chinensis]
MKGWRWFLQGFMVPKIKGRMKMGSCLLELFAKIKMFVRTIKHVLQRITPDAIDCLCYTKGPDMGAPLQVSAIVVRILSQLWKKPIVGVNHCVTHIEMGRIVTSADDLVVLNWLDGELWVRRLSKP